MPADGAPPACEMAEPEEMERCTPDVLSRHVPRRSDDAIDSARSGRPPASAHAPGASATIGAQPAHSGNAAPSSASHVLSACASKATGPYAVFSRTDGESALARRECASEVHTTRSKLRARAWGRAHAR